MGGFERRATREEADEAHDYVAALFAHIQSKFHEKGEDFDAEDANEILNDPPDPVQFPNFIFVSAIVKDFLDLLDLTLLGIPFTTMFSVFLGLMIGFWMFGKVKGRWWKKRILSYLIRRGALALGIEFIPFLKIIPTTAIFVLMAHYRETKIVKLMNEALETMREHGIRKA